MNFNTVKTFLTLLGIVSLVSCTDQAAVSDADGSAQPRANISREEAPEPISVKRWSSAEQVVLGREVFTQNCAVCHGAEAQGTVGDWREKLDDGSFPPPPLNGSAHAWHHPQEILLRVIDYGGEAMGGKMPAFIDVLEQNEKLAAVAYFQSFWTDEIYQQWMQMGGAN
ncbi:MAG: cytochrome C oxidase Cbb3 [SAR86 cluster bacterium]|uniref:Cytochrome C oxidase Cbb3 n=1 Tax=SAR86 cluster bacterium TaxID=2030880 RepID=A0A2A4WYG8_9GAMM|nr:MAG: cytochrome C oxidase Cbb3 [SAR86 cluster bacterium]